MPASVRYQPKAMGAPTVSGRARAQDAGGIYSACWGNLRGGGPTSTRLKPNVKVTIAGDRLPRLGGDVATFEATRKFLVAYSEYEHEKLIKNQNGGDPVLARRREIDLATQRMMVDVYDGKPWVNRGGSNARTQNICWG